MDKITVAELATECSVQNQVVLSELKRLGLYVFSPTATIDLSFADTIRKKIFSQREAEATKLAEAEKKKEAEAAKKAAKKAKAPAKKAAEVAEAAAPAPAPKKGKKAAKAEKVVEVRKPEEEIPKPSLAPRKGKKHYDRETAGLVEELPPPPLRAPEPTPSEIARELLADVGKAPVSVEPEPEEVLEPWYKPVEVVQPKPAVEPEAPPVAAAPEPAPPVEAAKPAEPVPHPGTVSKKIVIPKAKTKILMRTSTERVVTPDITDRILRGLRDLRAAP